MMYVTVPAVGGTDGIPAALHPKAHVLRVVRKAVPRRGVVAIVGGDGKPAINAATGKPLTKVGDVPTDNHRVSIYNEYALDWLDITVPGDMVVSTDLTAIHAKDRPRDVDVSPMGEVTVRRRVVSKRRLEAPKPLTDGKRVFAVMIGSERRLYDAENFDFVGPIAAGEKPAVAAAHHKRVLVGFAAASHYAKCERARAWRAGFLAQVAGRRAS